MELQIPPLLMLLLFLSALAIVSALSDHELGLEKFSGGRRVLLGFKETPHGNNVSFDCSPSGPCVPCIYSEKNNEKYRCSETGYRIPFKCTEIEVSSKVSKGKKSKKDGQRILIDDSSNSKSRPQAYITYRSCIPAANEERLSVLGFEAIVLVMLIASGSVVYHKRKNAAATGAPMRLPTSSRF